MSSKNVISCLGNCLLVLCAAFFTSGALISAFGFALSMGRLFVTLLISSAVVTVLFAIYRGWGIAMAAIPALVLFIINLFKIADDLLWVVYTVTLRYSEWLPVPVLFPAQSLRTQIPDSQLQEAMGLTQGQLPAPEPEPALFFAAFGIALVFLLAVTVCMKRSAWLTALATMLPVVLTFVLRSTPPGAVYLLGLCAVYITMLFSDAACPDDYVKSAMMYIPVFAMSVVFVSGIYLATPPSQYRRAAYVENVRSYVYDLAERIMDILSSMPGGEAVLSTEGWLDYTSPGEWRFRTGQVNVAGAGERIINDLELLEIQTSLPGTFYIRGFSMTDFDGRTWGSGDIPLFITGIEEIAEYWPAVAINNYVTNYLTENDESLRETETAQSGTMYPEGQDAMPLFYPAGMNIGRINDVTSVSYKPYYPRLNIPGVYEQLTGSTEMYDRAFYYVPGSVRDFITQDSSILLSENRIPAADMSAMSEMYTRIDEDTAQRLRELATDAGIDPQAEREVIADAVAAYVKSAASYTLTPPVMPEDEDFALYFLQTSRQGYCIHYATAAAMMLRALDVPARFTSGYVISVPRSDEGSPVIVTDRNAHAWVEVFYDDVGWLLLETTPSSRDTGIPIAPPHTPVDLTAETPEPAPAPATGAPEQQVRQGTAAGAGQGGGGTAMGVIMRGVLIFTAAACVLVLLLAIRRNVLNMLRKKRFTQKNTNAAVISIWQYTEKISRGQAVAPTDIEELALKARFSLHIITEDERGYMLSYAKRLAGELDSSKEEYGRLWYRYIRGFW